MDRFETEHVILCFVAILGGRLLVEPSWPGAVVVVALLALVAALRLLARLDYDRRLNALAETVAGLAAAVDETKRTAERARSVAVAAQAEKPRAY